MFFVSGISHRGAPCRVRSDRVKTPTVGQTGRLHVKANSFGSCFPWFFSSFSHTLCLTQVYSPCIHTPPENQSSPHLRSCSDNQAPFIQRRRGLNAGTFFFPVNSGTSLEENPRQGLKGPGRISGYENSSLVKI